MIIGPVSAEMLNLEAVVMAGAGLVLTLLTAIASFFLSRFVTKTEKTSDEFKELRGEVAVLKSHLKTAFGKIDELREEIKELRK